MARGLETCGLKFGRVSRCGFRSPDGQVVGAAHCDDILVAGPRSRVLRIGALLRARWELREQLIGGRPKDPRVLHMIGREVRRLSDGLAWAADPKHVADVLDELG